MIWQLPITIILLSLIPSAMTGIGILHRYRMENLNSYFFVKLMIWGAFSVLPGLFLVSLATLFLPEDFISTFIIKPFIAVAFIEELLKIIIIMTVLYRSRYFRTVKQGVIYGIAIAVGFAFAENIIYLTGTSGSYTMIVTRSLTTVPLHSLCGALMGLYAGIGKIHEKKYFAKSLFIPVFIHGTYNILVNMFFPYYLLSIILIFLTILFLKDQYRKSDSLPPFKDT